MCGRFAYNKKQITPWAEKKLGILIDNETNLDVSPTQSVVAIGQNNAVLSLSWGILPAWAKKPLINAQAETITTKKTFKYAFAHRRCLIPCSGWYEWKDEGGAKKQKYYFSSTDNQPFLMAGIGYEGEIQQVVTLTTQSNNKCADIHHRMPVIIPVDAIDRWFNHYDVADLLAGISDEKIDIARVSA